MVFRIELREILQTEKRLEGNEKLNGNLVVLSRKVPQNSRETRSFARDFLSLIRVGESGLQLEFKKITRHSVDR